MFFWSILTGWLTGWAEILNRIENIKPQRTRRNREITEIKKIKIFLTTENTEDTEVKQKFKINKIEMIFVVS